MARKSIASHYEEVTKHLPLSVYQQYPSLHVDFGERRQGQEDAALTQVSKETSSQVSKAPSSNSSQLHQDSQSSQYFNEKHKEIMSRMHDDGASGKRAAKGKKKKDIPGFRDTVDSDTESYSERDLDDDAKADNVVRRRLGLGHRWSPTPSNFKSSKVGASKSGAFKAGASKAGASKADASKAGSSMAGASKADSSKADSSNSKARSSMFGSFQPITATSLSPVPSSHGSAKTAKTSSLMLTGPSLEAHGSMLNGASDADRKLDEANTLKELQEDYDRMRYARKRALDIAEKVCHYTSESFRLNDEAVETSKETINKLLQQKADVVDAVRNEIERKKREIESLKKKAKREFTALNDLADDETRIQIDRLEDMRITFETEVARLSDEIRDFDQHVAECKARMNAAKAKLRRSHPQMADFIEMFFSKD